MAELTDVPTLSVGLQLESVDDDALASSTERPSRASRGTDWPSSLLEVDSVRTGPPALVAISNNRSTACDPWWRSSSTTIW